MRVTPNGPVIIEGDVVVVDAEGRVLRETRRVALCRCGQSSNKPFCDGSHARCGFVAP